MKSFALTIVACTLLTNLSPARAADAITASAGLKTATAAANRWKPDAVLTGVGSSEVKPDGTSTHWTYSFQSRSTRTCYRVVVLAAGNTVPTDLGECTLGRPVPATFVDSPAALGAARSAGFRGGETINLTLSHTYDRNLTPSRPCWDVASPETDFDTAKAVMRGWCVDPQSGKFVTRTAGEGGRDK